jgi:hypothetical protein
MRTDTVNENQEQCEEDFAAQLFDAPDIFKCLNNFFTEMKCFRCLEIRRTVASRKFTKIT